MTHEIIKLSNGQYVFDNGIVKGSIQNASTLGYIPPGIPSSVPNLLFNSFVPPIPTSNPQYPAQLTFDRLFAGFIFDWAKNFQTTKNNLPPSTSSNPYPYVAAFLQKFSQYVERYGYTTTMSGVAGLTFPRDPISKGIAEDFLGSTFTSVNAQGQVSGDLKVLQSQMNLNPASITFAGYNAFNHFLETFNYTNFINILNTNGVNSSTPLSNGGLNIAQATAKNIINALFASTPRVSGGIGTNTMGWTGMLSPLAVINNSTRAAYPQAASLVSFEDIYNSFVTNPTRTKFTNALELFYSEVTKKGEPFIPSNLISAWVAYVSNGKVGQAKVKSSSLDGNSSEKVVVINRILALLIKIIAALQQIGVSQTQRLKYITDFQKAYTKLQSQVPTFFTADTTVIGGTNSTTTTIRNELNTSFNTALIDNLRTLRGLWEDTGKRQQSNINQTNDAVNQQIDMVTTFLQQMSSLSSTILR